MGGNGGGECGGAQDGTAPEAGGGGDVVVFLDMDGVVASPRAFLAQPGKPRPDRWIDPVAIGLLNTLCRVGGAVVVVSSTWREDRTGAEFAELLARAGFTGALHEDWRTLSLPNRVRGDEVSEWMRRHPECRRHVILDDEDDFHEGQPLVKSDSIDGFGYAHFKAALEVLRPGEDAMERALQKQAA